MTISALQQAAFVRAPEFVNQVNAIVGQQALYKYETTMNISPQSRDVLAQVVRQPGSYGFVNTILYDAGWATTYDAWATNPAASDAAILAGVQKAWPLLVGDIVTVPAAEPEPEVGTV